METRVNILDYNTYTSLGFGTVPSADFESVARRAQWELNSLCFARLNYMQDIGAEMGEEIIFALCATCDLLYNSDACKENGQTISSYSNDGVSVTYAVDAKQEDKEAAAVKTEVKKYLVSTKLLSPLWVKKYDKR